MTKIRTPWRATALAASVALTGGTAMADVRYEGGGDFSAAPLYRALNYGFIYDQRTGAIDLEGLDYASNVAPRVNVVETGRMDMDGATAWYTGSAQYSGFYAARTFASITVANARSDHMYYWVAGQGTTTSLTFFDPAAAAARAEFRWHVTGTSDSSSGTGRADGRIDFHATTDGGRNWLDLFNGGFEGTLSAFGPGTYTYTLPSVPLGTPINLFFWTSAFVELMPGDLADGSGTTLTANYSRTIVLESVALFDADDNPVSGWTAVDTASGTALFDDSGRLAPVLPAAPIPEPGTWAMMLGGLASLGWLRRRAMGARPAALT